MGILLEYSSTMMNITENATSPAIYAEYLPVIHFVMLWALFILAIPGLLINLTICILTFHPAVDGDYKWFIFNLSMIGSIYSVSNFVHAHWMLFRNDYDGIFCKISAVLHWYCVLVTLFALLPISFNRICSLRYQKLYQRIFTPFGIVITLFVCDLIPLMLILPYPLAFVPIKRYTDGGYSCDFDTPINFGGMLYSGLVLLETPLLFAVLIAINLKILLIVRSRKNAPTGVSDTSLRLKETNNLMRATVLQAVVPMLVQVPVLITTAVFIVGGPVPGQWDVFSVFIHSVNPIGDGMITFLIVKSYMKALRMKLNKIAPYLKLQDTQVPTTVVSMTLLNKHVGRGSRDTLTAVA